MRKVQIATCLGAMALFAAGTANANEELIKMAQNPKDWVMPTGDYANTRYSKLNQITAANAGKLQVAWTFSTGVLRGHEGGPLIIGNMMYVHTPFPNKVYALDLSNENKIVWKYEPKQDPNVIPVMCCDTVNRGVAYGDGKIFLHQADTTLVALDAKTGKLVWSVKNGDPKKGETGTSAPMVVKDKVIDRQSRAANSAFAVRDRLQHQGRQAGLARLFDGTRQRHADRSGEDHALGKPVGKDSGTNTWEGDQWKIGGGPTWGWYCLRSRAEPDVLRIGQPLDLESEAAAGRQRWSMTIFARDVDTGMASWVYQMTPHDEWDYDGVNEMILSDQQIGGQAAQTTDPFRSQRAGLHARPRHRRIAGCRKVRSEGQLDQRRRYEQEFADLRPSQGRRSVFDRKAAAKTSTPRVSARQRWAPRTSSRQPIRRIRSCSMCRPTMSAWTMSRSR